ncbi:unnamed protein product, partial [Schistosoma curassoni]|uniref:Uncharacterized protein n=1 Tax=Schistosoma curassoni TaxID=6186 RepID=A0A183JS77_9TREM
LHEPIRVESLTSISFLNDASSDSFVRSYSREPSLNEATWYGPSERVTLTGDRVIISPPPLGNIRACTIISKTDVFPEL